MNIMDLRYAKRDAMMVDYIQRHPERFPEPRMSLNDFMQFPFLADTLSTL